MLIKIFVISLLWSAHAQLLLDQVVSDDLQNVCFSIDRVVPPTFEIEQLNNTIRELKGLSCDIWSKSLRYGGNFNLLHFIVTGQFDKR